MSLLALALTLGTVAPLSASHPAVHSASFQETQRCCELYPAARGSLEVRIGDGENFPSLREIADEYAGLTRLNLVFDEATAALLQASRGGLQASISVPATEVQSFFEQLLAANDLTLQMIRREKPRVVRILPLDQVGAGLLPRAQFIDADQVQHFAKHPATWVTTSVHLPGSDVRKLANSLRGLQIDRRAEVVSADGSSATLMVSGFGSSVAEIVHLLGVIHATTIEQEASLQHEIVRIEHAEAFPLSQVLTRAFGAAPSGGTTEQASSPPSSPRIVVDLRTNSLVLVGTSEELQRIRGAIQVLDVLAE